MGLQLLSSPSSSTTAQGQAILHAEADAIHIVADRLDGRFDALVDALWNCSGRVVVSGVGKSADVGQKIVGTFNSTGTRAYFLDATRALHGDLGTIHPDDVALLLSHSGESEEIVRLLPSLKSLCTAITAITSNVRSTLARACDEVLVYGSVTETCPLSLAPSTSTTVMIALGDALAFVLSERRGFRAEDFAKFHPAGSLGRKLAPVSAYMRKGEDLRIALAMQTVRSVFAQAQVAGRRTGAVMLVDSVGRLVGLFTDSDLARLFERRQDSALDRPISEVMTANPLTIPLTARLSDALEVFRLRKVSELPVVSPAGQPVGLVDITDVIGLLPVEDTSSRIRRESA